ncbi:Origin recognition complex subunit 3 [Spathaspora sp. JA1]|nr:Origin recognition complex subunit 3 [Spathaspora sp. JA1]
MPPRRKRQQEDIVEIDVTSSEDDDDSTPELQDDNNQKTFYYLTPKPTTNPSGFTSIYSRLTNSKKHKVSHTPFISLFNGLETQDDVERRYELYTKIWENQLTKIQTLLNNANDELFSDLIKFINSEQTQKLGVGFLQLTSNIANNLRTLNEFKKVLVGSDDGTIYKTMSINSKNCTNIRSALREIIKQFETDEEAEEEEEDEEEDMGHEPTKANYDLDIIENWFTTFKNKSKIRLVLILEDTNSINNHVLNQLFKVMSAYSNVPWKIIMGLSCDNISNWINTNLGNNMRLAINGYKFKSNDNKSLGYIILNNLFLTPELTDDNPLLLSKTTTTIILNRFENSNNSIDSLIAEIKLCYMIYFYQSPLSILLVQHPKGIYVQGLRKLPSFKRYIEFRLQEGELEEIEELLTKDDPVIDLFNESKVKFQRFKLIGMNSINVIYQLHNKSPIRKQKFELYKLLLSNKLLNSKYLNDILRGLSKLTDLEIGAILLDLTDDCQESIGEFHDTNLTSLNKAISEMTDFQELADRLRDYFNNEVLLTPLDEVVFHEIFSMNGGLIREKWNRQPIFEENLENLMINLVRPNLRSTIESGLDNCEIYLGNALIENGITTATPIISPTLSHLFKVYKEAPVAINIYDFYQAFSMSLNRTELQKSLNRDMSQTEWDKMTYAWFIQNCFELMLMGLLKEKPKGDFLEKAIWKGV